MYKNVCFTTVESWKTEPNNQILDLTSFFLIKVHIHTYIDTMSFSVAVYICYCICIVCTRCNIKKNLFVLYNPLWIEKALETTNGGVSIDPG